MGDTFPVELDIKVHIVKKIRHDSQIFFSNRFNLCLSRK